ncbi:MAG: DUF4129 domain-containing protein [Candidatus Limnocylindrales bacterium]
MKIEPWVFIAAAAVGIALARRLGGRPFVVSTAAIVVLAGLVGWLFDPAVRALVASAAFGPAASMHATGWLLGLAAWRGTRHGDRAYDDAVVGSLLSWGTVGLAVPWLVGTVIAARSQFLAVALPSTLLFVAAGLVAVGLTRLDALGRSTGLDWRANRTWLALLIGIVGLVALIGTPTALLLGVPVEALIRAILSPFEGPARAFGGLLGPLLGPSSIQVVPGASVATPAPGSGSGSGSPSVLPTLPNWAAALIALAFCALLVAMAVWVWRRIRGGRPAVRWHPPEVEERRISLPGLAIRPRRPHLPHLSFARSRRPVTASEAYLALLRQFADDERMARRTAESPAAHARRLRLDGTGSLAFDLLAADYALERYAGARLTPAEIRRAVRRWRSGRSTQRRPSAPAVRA